MFRFCFNNSPFFTNHDDWVVISFCFWPCFLNPHLLTYSFFSYVTCTMRFLSCITHLGDIISLRQLSLLLLFTTVGWLHCLTLRGQLYFPWFQSLPSLHVFPAGANILISRLTNSLVWSEADDRSAYWGQRVTKRMKQAWWWAGWCGSLRSRPLELRWGSSEPC